MFSINNNFYSVIKSSFYKGMGVAVLLLLNIVIFAQTDDIPSETFTIIKDFEPVLVNAERIDIYPSQIGLASNENPGAGLANYGQYDVPNNFLTLAFEPPTLKPLAYKYGKESMWNYRFWLKAGYGNLNTPFADLSLSTRPSKKFMGGFNAKYHSSNGVDVNFQDFRDASGKLFGKWFFDRVYWGLDLNYEHNFDTYYGATNIENYTERNNLEIFYNTGIANVEFGDISNDYTELNHKTILTYRYHQNDKRFNQFRATEHTVQLTSDLEKTTENGFGFGGDIMFAYTQHTNDFIYFDPLNNSLLSVNPEIFYSRPWGTLKGGAGLFLDGDEFSAFPKIYAEFFVIEKALTVFGGWHQEVQQNTLYSFSRVNPFLSDNIFYDNSLKESRYGGVKGNLASNFTYSLSGGQYIVEKQALFVTDFTTPDDFNSFEVVYDSLTSVGGQLELAYHFGKEHNIRLGASYFDYETANEAEAWHLPNLTVNLGGTYSPINKLTVGLDFFLYEGINARLSNGEAQLLSTIVDVNLNADYHFNEHFGVFVDLNNLTNSKYQRLINYDSYGFNALGGVMVRF